MQATEVGRYDEVPGYLDKPMGPGGSCYVMAQTVPQKMPGDLQKRVVYCWPDFPYSDPETGKFSHIHVITYWK